MANYAQAPNILQLKVERFQRNRAEVDAKHSWRMTVQSVIPFNAVWKLTSHEVLFIALKMRVNEFAGGSWFISRKCQSYDGEFWSDHLFIHGILLGFLYYARWYVNWCSKISSFIILSSDLNASRACACLHYILPTTSSIVWMPGSYDASTNARNGVR